jgi:tetratricopeptide (TPR) repeat protein
MKSMRDKTTIEGDITGIAIAHNSTINQTIIQNNKHEVPKQLTTKTSTYDNNFIGREDEIKAIDEMLDKSNSLLLINGIGGIGKSSLANHYLYIREKEFDYYGFIEGLGSFISEFRNSLDLKSQKEDELYREIIYKLQKLNGNKLLVIDNVEDIEANKTLIEMILSLGKYKYKILFTSRRKIKKVKSYHLDTLLPIDAQKLFLSYYKTDEVEKVDMVIEYLGLHTLFIKLVADTIENEGYSLDDILQKFENGELSKIEFIDEKSGDEITFNYNLQELFSMQNLKDEYVLLLKRLAVLPSIDIELSFLEDILDEERLKGRLNFLVGRGWLIESDEAYKLHQIIKEYILSNHIPTFEEIEIIIDCFKQIMGYTDDAQVVANNRGNLVYFESVTILLKKLEIKNRKVGSFFNNFGNVYRHLGMYLKAKPLYRNALKVFEEKYPYISTDMATSYDNLAIVYNSIGDYQRAEQLSFEALIIREETLGEEHPVTAISYNNLAEVYRSMGKYEKAEVFYIKALQIYEKVFDKEEHPFIATSYGNLALVYDSMEVYEKAQPLYLRALEISEIIWGEEHPNTARSYNDLGLFYWSMEEYEKAEPLYLKSLQIREKVLGEEHSDTAISYNNIALLYSSIKSYNKARPLYIKALKIREKILGEEHPETANSYYNLAEYYVLIEEYKEAEFLYLKSLKINEKIWGAEHSNTADSYYALGGFYMLMNEFEKGYNYCKKAVDVYSKVLVPNHRNLINAKKGLEMIKISRKTTIKPSKIVGRNDPCPCNSGKKYKKCCGKPK